MSASETISFTKAINKALDSAMEEDNTVVVYGLDINDHKRILGSTENLIEKYGPKRCLTTPLSEDAMTGAGIGMSFGGLRPVHIHIRADFLLLTLNQLVNIAASYKHVGMRNHSIPLVVRAIIGRGWGQGAQHSKSLYGMFAQVPGLKVFLPSTVQDGYSLLRQAIDDPNPSLFIEHRWMHYMEGKVDLSHKKLSSVEKIRSGSDITVIGLSWMVVESVKAAEILSKHGIEVEVIKVNELSDIDYNVILESVNKTGRLIIADYDWCEFGASSEIGFAVYQMAMKTLKSPIRRLGFARTHCPATRPLENEFYSNAEDIVETCCELLGHDKISLKDEDLYSYENKFKGPF